jgi:hypothetical protein
MNERQVEEIRGDERMRCARRIKALYPTVKALGAHCPGGELMAAVMALGVEWENVTPPTEEARRDNP